MSAFTPALFKPNYLFANDSWNRVGANIVLNQFVNLSYSFVTAFPAYYNFSTTNVSLTDLSTFGTSATVTGFTQAQRDVVPLLGDMLSRYAKITLVPASSGITGEVTFGNPRGQSHNNFHERMNFHQ
jgi:hypothetical protein